MIFLGDDAELYLDMQEDWFWRQSCFCEERKDDNSNYENLYLVDGDNHVYEAIKNVKKITSSDKVLIFISQEALREKLNRYCNKNINIALVKAGNQAVDNRIKGYFGNAVKSNKYKNISVISHDKGYDDLVQKYRRKYGIDKSRLSRKDRI